MKQINIGWKNKRKWKGYHILKYVTKEIEIIVKKYLVKQFIKVCLVLQRFTPKYYHYLYIICRIILCFYDWIFPSISLMEKQKKIEYEYNLLLLY